MTSQREVEDIRARTPNQRYEVFSNVAECDKIKGSTGLSQKGEVSVYVSKNKTKERKNEEKCGDLRGEKTQRVLFNYTYFVQ